MTPLTDDQLEAMMRHFTRGHHHEIGFLPSSIYAAAHRDGRLLSIVHDGTPESILLCGRPGHTLRIFQTLTAPDLRLTDLARQNVLTAITHAAGHDCERVSLRCAVDLPANEFWRQMGFNLVAIEKANNLVSRDCYRWEWRFPRGEALDKYLAAQLQDVVTRRLCELMSFGDQLLAHRRRTWRRRNRQASHVDRDPSDAATRFLRPRFRDES